MRMMSSSLGPIQSRSGSAFPLRLNTLSARYMMVRKPVHRGGVVVRTTNRFEVSNDAARDNLHYGEALVGLLLGVANRVALRSRNSDYMPTKATVSN